MLSQVLYRLICFHASKWIGPLGKTRYFHTVMIYGYRNNVILLNSDYNVDFCCIFATKIPKIQFKSTNFELKIGLVPLIRFAHVISAFSAKFRVACLYPFVICFCYLGYAKLKFSSSLFQFKPV